MKDCRKNRNMHRSASMSRTSDEFFINISPSLKGSPGMKTVEIDQLPTYDLSCDLAKKETARTKLAEISVHLIPVVLIICALLLWIFSYPDEVMAKQGDSVIIRDQRVHPIIEGYPNQTSLSPAKGPLAG